MPKPEALTYIKKTGAAIHEVLDELGRLRIAVFRDFPYLYEGDLEYEKNYLQTYLNAERSFLFAAYDGELMVGATTCIPLSDETDEVKKPFEEAGIAQERVFYFGESILMKPYRGLGLGHRFFDERETHAASFGTYEMTSFCAVDRGSDHPLQPSDYRPNDAFWLKRGYTRNPTLQAEMHWPDLGETESTSKKMVFWTRPISS